MIYCKHCKEKTKTVYKKKGPHFGGYCSICFSLKKWVPKNEVDISKVKTTFNKPLI